MPKTLCFWLFNVLLSVGIFCPISALANPSDLAISQMAVLMPSGSSLREVVAGSSLSEKIDSLTLEILSTTTGKTFCQAVIDDNEIIHRAFFINSTPVSEARRLCGNNFATSITHRPWTKRFYIVLDQTGQSKVRGWTSPRNETFLFVNSNELENMRSSALFETLIHEMSVSYDKKENIGLFGRFNGTSFGLSDDSALCENGVALRTGNIKHSLSTLRAYDMDMRILSDLGLPVPEHIQYLKTQSCLKKISFIYPYIQAINLAYAAEDYLNSLLDRPICKTAALTPESSEQAIVQLLNSFVTYTDGSMQTVCDFMTSGWPFFASTSFRGGPGPRIGGSGWDKKIKIAETKAKIQKPADNTKPTPLLKPEENSLYKQMPKRGNDEKSD